MWLLSMLTLLVVALVMWLTDHGGTIDTKMTLANELPELYGRYKSRLTSGYLTGSRLIREVPPSLANGIHTLITGPSSFTTQAVHAGVLNIAISVFAMIWMLVYGAQLCSSLTVTKLTVPVTDISHPSTGLVAGQLSGVTGLACTMGGAAYTNWIKTNFPDMLLNENGVLLDEMMEEMRAARCDSILLVTPLSGKVTANCGLGKDVGGAIQRVGTPLAFGPQDMAVGVRKDMPHAQVAISYWLQELRGCNPTTAKSPCYNEMNMAQIFDKWMNTVQCPTGKSGPSSIDYVNFLYVFLICWVGAGLAFLWEICQLRYRDRMVAVFKGSGLWQCITTEPFSCINQKTGQISLGRVRKAFTVSFITASQGDSAAYYNLMCCLRRYYVGTDLVAWQKVLATTKEMKTELTILNANGTSVVLGERQVMAMIVGKHSDKENMAIARLGTFWRNRQAFKAQDLRRRALLDLQERLLLAAVSAIEKDEATKNRDARIKSLSAAKSTKKIQPLEAVKVR